jgi:hypothetical protein
MSNVKKQRKGVSAYRTRNRKYIPAKPAKRLKNSQKLSISKKQGYCPKTISLSYGAQP